MLGKEINKNLCTNNVITCDNLKIYFDKKEKQSILINNFSFAFAKKKIYFLIGNSGVGKTILVSHFNGLMKSKVGNIYIEDYAILAKNRKIKNCKKIRKSIGMVFQFPEYQLFKDTIEKDIMFGPLNFGVNKQTAKLLAKKYLNKLGLSDDYLNQSPFALSGGQKRRVAIAGILAIEPNILIFDEPTAGLDPVGEKQLLKIITDLKNEGKTVIVITHNMDHVLEIADEVLLLHNKQLFKVGKPYDIYCDNEILEKTEMVLPKVINVINKLIEINPKFKKIYDFQPRNIDQLTSAISAVISKKETIS